MIKPWTISQISELIRNVADFPKPGIQFKDITPILENAEAFHSLAQHMKAQIDPATTKLLAIESRGFILGSAVAQYMNVGMVLVRKPGKLPRPTIQVTYDLEYGKDRLEIHADALNSADRVTVIDDVLATGGTAHAVETLVTKSGATVLGSCFLMELTALRGGAKLDFPYHSLLKI